ncbi:DNA-3-methyladenine glycosylase I [Kangiella shandongensis]|uniref:DNA-3-methyladenine glycosylase I n=1 Tax=Kangiella shandongensis TaxID=2763258 RepID=UPI001CBB5025|nr:DNA-3-methyladenine glycosylase I [Kangiella shandongensis]
MTKRCGWVSDDPLYIDYHDNEWGKPEYDDKKLFEMLCLEGAQAGLSWITVLKKREHYRKVFDNFNPHKIAQYDEAKREALLSDPGIIRNKLKVNAFIVNAQRYLEVTQEQSFKDYVWQFVGGAPVNNRRTSLKEVPATTAESDAMSKQLKKDGFKFVGSTICYAFMQATGMVDDHIEDCFLG